VTVKETAKRLEVSQSLVYRLIEERRLACVRVGQRGRRGKIIIREADLAEFLRQCQKAAR
jgi:excisionase family DNA binding protein